MSSRIRALHRLLLAAATLRTLLAECAASMTKLTKDLQLARKTFVKVFGLYALDGSKEVSAAHWDDVKERLRCELQARTALARHTHLPLLLRAAMELAGSLALY